MSAPALPPNGRRILVVEDEYLIASEMKRWLQSAGFEVIGPVPSVEKALTLIEGAGPDAAVLDVNLGAGETAYPVADRLSALGVPYLFATGDVRVPAPSAEDGPPRLEKPFVAQQLVHALCQLLD
jgi:DNA-binding response OmpR family regulator